MTRVKNRIVIGVAGLLSSLLCLVFAQSALAEDLMLKGGMLVDGTGQPVRIADVEIRDGRIAKIGNNLDTTSLRVVNVSGMVVAPGFIDLHSHAEEGLSDPHRNTALNNLTQGITTVVLGQDGLHAWTLGGSLDEQNDLWRKQGVGNNVVPLVGQGIARVEAIGPVREAASPEQALAVSEKVRSYLGQGAWGLSTGLGYFPGRSSSTAEIIEATRPVNEIDGFYITHLRDQGDHLLEAIEEAIQICRQADVRCVITHIKTAGMQNWGKADEAITLIKAARKEGLQVYADLYPYRASDSGINFTPIPPGLLFSRDEMAMLFAPVAIPPEAAVAWSYLRDPRLSYRFKQGMLERQPWPLVSGLIGANERIRSEPAYRYRLREMMADVEKSVGLLEQIRASLGGEKGAEQVVVSSHPNSELLGMSLANVADLRKTSVERAAADLTLEGVSFTQYQMAEEDIVAFIKQDFVAGGTDGEIPEYGIDEVHPRSYGTFTKRLADYVYEQDIIDLPFAIKTATGLPAEIIGLTDRGLLLEGFWADIVVFDPVRISDRATYSAPHQYSSGMDWVLVNGEIAIEDGIPSQIKSGQILLKTQVGQKD